MSQDLLNADEAAAPVKRGRGRPAGDHGAKRADLLKAAISVIARDGYAGASLRSVAQHAGCRLGGVTYYFASKDEMVTAVAERLFDVFDTVLDEPGGVRAMFDRWFGFNDDQEAWLALFQLLGHAREEPAFAAVFARRYGQYRERFTAILADAQRRGQVRSDVPADLLADLLSAVGDGWMIAFPIERERFTPQRIQALMDALFQVIAPPKA